MFAMVGTREPIFVAISGMHLAWEVSSHGSLLTRLSRSARLSQLCTVTRFPVVPPPEYLPVISVAELIHSALMTHIWCAIVLNHFIDSGL